MDWKYKGFLAPRHRKYLAGEKDIEAHSNRSEFEKGVRERYAGATQDESLIQMGIANGVLPKEVIKEPNVNRKLPLNQSSKPPQELPMTDEAIENNKGAAKTRGESVGVDSDGIEDIFDEMKQRVQEVDLEEAMEESDAVSDEDARKAVQEVYEELFAGAFIVTVDGMLEAWAGDVDKEEVVSGLIEAAWPEQERVLEKAREELSNR